MTPAATPRRRGRPPGCKVGPRLIGADRPRDEDLDLLDGDEGPDPGDVRRGQFVDETSERIAAAARRLAEAEARVARVAWRGTRCFVPASERLAADMELKIARSEYRRAFGLTETGRADKISGINGLEPASPFFSREGTLSHLENSDE
ncbi:MAG: hypothetical protein KIT09_02605 [Bryobacteraceae bacterium]|nr:hypothetical protein [Bryobacteraceae bacterium]